MSGLQVEYGQIFSQHLPNFPKNDRMKIAQFVHHV